MPYSYSQPSTSEASWNSGEANADANWGVPEKCFCGKPVKLEVCKTGYRQGDRVYKCPMLKVSYCVFISLEQQSTSELYL